MELKRTNVNFQNLNQEKMDYNLGVNCVKMSVIETTVINEDSDVLNCLA